MGNVTQVGQRPSLTAFVAQFPAKGEASSTEGTSPREVSAEQGNSTQVGEGLGEGVFVVKALTEVPRLLGICLGAG